MEPTSYSIMEGEFMEGNKAAKTFEYRADIHSVFRDHQGNFYCRAANAILKDFRYCEICPLLCGSTQGDQQGNPECYYFDLFPLPDVLSIRDQKKRIDGLIQAGIMPLFPEFSYRNIRNYDINLEKAIQYAAIAHKGQHRKGTRIPYIVHPLEAAVIVAGMTRNPEIIAAAALHDVAEDTKFTIDDIAQEFGNRVANLVASESENKRKELPAEATWKIRKSESLDHLLLASKEVKMIALGDKLSNMREISRDYDQIGDKLWTRFNQTDKSEQAWYYKTIARIFEPEFREYPAWQEYDSLVQKIFGN